MTHTLNDADCVTMGHGIYCQVTHITYERSETTRQPGPFIVGLHNVGDVLVSE